MKFSKVMGVQKYIKNQARLMTRLDNDILRHTPVYFLMSCSPAEPTSAFTGNYKNRKSKAYSGLSLICKPKTGLITENCQLFSGRDILISPLSKITESGHKSVNQ